MNIFVILILVCIPVSSYLFLKWSELTCHHINFPNSQFQINQVSSRSYYSILQTQSLLAYKHYLIFKKIILFYL